VYETDDDGQAVDIRGMQVNKARRANGKELPVVSFPQVRQRVTRSNSIDWVVNEVTKIDVNVAMRIVSYV